MADPPESDFILKLAPRGGPGGELPPLVLHKGSYRIGRAADNDFVLTGSGIVPHHCRIAVHANRVELEPAEPAARISLNGRAVGAGPALQLLSGDQLALGELRFQVTIDKGGGARRRPPPRPAPPLCRTGDTTILPKAAPFRLPGMDSEFAGYRLEDAIGSGATAAVFRAVSLDTNCVVALKVLKPGVELESDAALRLFREAMIGGQLASHPGIVRIIEVGRAGPFSYIAMEYVDGKDVEALLSERGVLPVPEAVDIILEAARCLQFARRYNIIHRDLKPGNLMVAKNGHVRLLDLGLARVAGATGTVPVTMSKQGMGTPTYIAPEQAMSAAEVDHRADIYSLGASLFVMVTGRPPLQPGPAHVFLQRLLHEPPPALASLSAAFSEPLSVVVATCLEKDPAKRYADYPDLIRALEAVRSQY